jgi:hypothetical protein
MATKRTATVTLCAVILIGGGATAFAASTDAPPRPSVEMSAQLIEARRTDAAAADTSDTKSASSGVPDEAIAPSPSTTDTPLAKNNAADETAGLSDRIAGPSGQFGTMSTVPPDWNGFDDPGTDSTDDGPGLPFDVSTINLDSLISLARSVGITVGDPITADDGSVTVSATLPNNSRHTVWVSFDDNNRIVDATVDGTPLAEFVRQFLRGDFDSPRTTIPTTPPDWNLPD